MQKRYLYQKVTSLNVPTSKLVNFPCINHSILASKFMLIIWYLRVHELYTSPYFILPRNLGKFPSLLGLNCPKKTWSLTKILSIRSWLRKQYSLELLWVPMLISLNFNYIIYKWQKSSPKVCLVFHSLFKNTSESTEHLEWLSQAYF